MKGIIMSAESVRAILDGRKSQTRRVVKWIDHANPNLRGMYQRTSGGLWSEVYGPPDDPNKGMIVMSKRRCPYGKPGDVLYCKEPWQAWSEYDHLQPSEIPQNPNAILHVADRLEERPWDAKMRSPIHMPEWASRLKIMLTDVRVERLQDISEADAIAEGIKVQTGLLGESVYWDYLNNESRSPRLFSATDSYYTLWDSINGKRGYPWESNPFVWVLSFRAKGEG
jgi:hypothetical protein